jgi:hypothetical protein
MGTGSCSSSTCHGSVNPIKNSNILGNEYYTWQKHDKHSKAYSVLNTPEARKISAHLKLGDPTKEAQCLTCHTTYVTNKDLQGERYSIEDGVSCESCHGASEGWLAAHTESSATHERNLQQGLNDTVSLDKRANLCLSCHFGDQSNRVTHDLYGAGHPRLRFELDTYGILQPKHWDVDRDYRARKGAYIPARAWLVGQVAHSAALINVLSDPKRSKHGIFPELSLFDCFSCHHDLSQQQWRNNSYGGAPGTLKLNLTPLELTGAALSELQPSLATKLLELTNKLNSEYQRDSATLTLNELKNLINTEVLPFSNRISADDQTCSKILGGLIKLSPSSQSEAHSTIKFESAEQIGMGIQAILATSPALAKKHEAHLKALFKTIERAESFNSRDFYRALGGFN